MGSTGSGRQGGGRCTDNMRALDVRKIHREGLLSPGRLFSWRWSCNGETTARIDLHVDVDRVFLSYRSRRHFDAEWESINYAVGFAWTPCTLGGRRVWWLCPGVGCGRRVAALYGGRLFACRHCHRLAYRSQRESERDRASREVNTIRRRLGWPAGFLNDTGGKPKGMHWRTYWRLYEQHNKAMTRALAGFGARLGVLRRQLDEIAW